MPGGVGKARGPPRVTHPPQALPAAAASLRAYRPAAAERPGECGWLLHWTSQATRLTHPLYVYALSPWLASTVPKKNAMMTAGWGGGCRIKHVGREGGERFGAGQHGANEPGGGDWPWQARQRIEGARMAGLPKAEQWRSRRRSWAQRGRRARRWILGSRRHLIHLIRAPVMAMRTPL